MGEVKIADRAGATRQDSWIADKIGHLDDTITALQAGEVIIARVGGLTNLSAADQIAFQQWRRGILVWASTATADEIRDRIQIIELAMGAEGIQAKFGVVGGLSDEAVKLVVEAELLDIALGQHPVQLAEASGVTVGVATASAQADALATFEASQAAVDAGTLTVDLSQALSAPGGGDV